MSALKYFLAPVLMSTFALPSQARWFEVEVLLFARNQDPTELDEDFSQSRLTPMTVRKQELLESVLLAPSDCPEPEEVAHDTLYDEFGFPIAAPPELEAGEANEWVTSPSEPENVPAHEPPVKTPTDEADNIESGVRLDEFGFPIEETGRTPEEQAAYEQWLLDCEKPKALNEYDLLPVTISPSQLPLTDEEPYLLPTENLQLGDALQKLISNPNYQPMLHTGWRMDIQSKRQMPAIRLVAGRNFGQQFNDDGWEHLEPLQTEEESSESMEPIAEQEASPLALVEQANPLPEQATALAQEPEDALYDTDSLIQALLAEESNSEKEPRQEAVWEMQADIRIWLASWLHMEAQGSLRRLGRKTPQDLAEQTEALPELTQEIEPTGTLMATAATVPYLYGYHMDQFRRVRSEEIHYFDHPLMGIVIQIRPYTPRELPEEEQL